MNANKKKSNEELLEEELNKHYKELGIDKMIVCDHDYKCTTTIKVKWEFFIVTKTFTCTKCGASFTMRWSEHKSGGLQVKTRKSRR